MIDSFPSPRHNQLGILIKKLMGTKEKVWLHGQSMTSAVQSAEEILNN